MLKISVFRFLYVELLLLMMILFVFLLLCVIMCCGVFLWMCCS